MNTIAAFQRTRPWRKVADAPGQPSRPRRPRGSKVAILAALSVTLGGLASPSVAAAAAATVVHPAATVIHPAGGAIPDKARIAPRVSMASTAVPSSVDLSPWAVPVGDQGPVGSCVSWAISYAMGGWYSRYQGLSQAGIQFAPMYTYSQDDVGSDGGSYPSDAYTIAANQGVDTQADYTQGNYDWWDLPTAAERANAANYKAGPFSYLYSGTPGAAAQGAIESAVANHQPVALMIPVYSAFDNLTATNNHLDASQIDASTFRGIHEVLIVGYDSTGVLIQNSWGTGWGSQGFAWLNWNFVDSYSYEATVMTGLIRPVVGSPDLVVASLSWSPTAPSPGSAVQFTATIKNQGSGATPAGVKHGVAFFVDGTEVTWSDTDTASLAPGASITLTANSGPAKVSTWKATAGNHTIKAYIDDSKLITESNETNNTLSKSITVGPALPDLVVASLSWSPTALSPGSAVQFTATIKNQGSGATPAGVKHGVAFFVDGTEVTWSDTDTASLAPGASITLTANSGPAKVSTWKATAGNHTIKAYIDDSKLITESNETNNTLSKSLTI